MTEEEKQKILDAVSKFLGRDNLYASVKATYPHTPSIDMDSIGDTNPNDIIHLYFDEKIDFINNKFERKLYLAADYWVETKILWERVWLPMEQFSEAYKMFLDKYEKLDGKNKLSKEIIKKYRKELKMTDITEQQTIIKNAIEFLKRDNLQTVLEEDYDQLAIKNSNNLELYDVSFITRDNSNLQFIVGYKTEQGYSHGRLVLKDNDYMILHKLFKEKFKEVQEKQNKSFFSKELEKKANWNCEKEPVCSKCVEHSEINNTKQDADINIPNKGKYKRKSDGKIFFLISQHELKTTMNGITPLKEICEIVVGITKIYVLFSPALEGRYNHDILYVKENELNEDYEMLSEN